MAMTYQNFASLGVNLNRQKYGPLDISNVFTSAADLKYYLTKGTFTEGVSEYWYKSADEKIVPYPYEGQVLATAIDGDVKVYVLQLDAEGEFEAKAIEPEVDGKTIKLTNGKLELVGLPAETSGKTYVPSLVNGVLTWAEPDTSTAEGQQQAIDGLTTRMTAVETTINGKPESTEGAGDAVVGLVDKVAALEAVDYATQDELDTAIGAASVPAVGEPGSEDYKEGVEATGIHKVIEDALQAAKDYADAQDADTIYDDSEVKASIKAIADDYLTSADKYDDAAVTSRLDTAESKITALEDSVGDASKGLTKAIADEKARAEAAESDLSDRIDAIDFVDSTELATALEPYATTEYVDTQIEAVEDAISKLNHFTTKIVTSIDDVTETGILYLIKDETVIGVDKYNEYIVVDGAAVLIGDTTTDLSNYYNKTEIDGKVNTINESIADEVEAREALADEVAALKAVDNATQEELNAYKLEVTEEIRVAKEAAISDADGKLANKLDTATFTEFQGTNETAISGAKDAAIAAAKSETENQVGALADTVASTYATKAELTESIEGIENDLLGYVTTGNFATELAKKADADKVYIKTEIDDKIGLPGTPAVKDEEGNVVTEAIAGTGVYQHVYSKDEVTSLIADITGGESAADVLAALNAYKTTNDTRVKAVEDVNASQTTAIEAAQEQADKGVADAAKVAADLVTANLAIAENTRQIDVVDGKVDTINETLTSKITALEGKDATIEGNITALQTLTSGHTTTITEQGTKIAALENEDLRLAGLIQGNTDKFANYSTTEQVNKAIDDKIAAIPAVDFTGYATESYVGDAIAALDLDNKLNGKVDSTAFESYKTETVTLIGTKANAADVYTKTDADAAFMTEGEVDARINALINAADPEGGKTITDIQNLVKYVEENAGEIAGLVTTVGEHTTAIASNTAAHEANASAIEALQSTVGEHTTAIQKNTDDIRAINTALAGIVQPKASTEITVADDGTLGLGKVSTDKLEMGTDTLIIDGGSSAN